MVDEISDEVVVVLLKDKTGDSVINACKRAHALITTRAKSSLKTWQFDRGSEFMNKAFDHWIHMELGAKQQFSNVEHPWENGIAERSLQTIFNKARAMMKYAHLPNIMWGKAVLHAVFLKNRSPSTSTGVYPLQFRIGRPYDFTKVRVFGCPAQIFIRPLARVNPKLSNRSEQGTFVGMSLRGNGYIFLVPRTRTLVEVDSKDVLFNETFSDCRDRRGRIIPNGAAMRPDLHADPPSSTEQADPDFDSLPTTDGVIAAPQISPPAPAMSNRYDILSDPADTPADADTSDDAPVTTTSDLPKVDNISSSIASPSKSKSSSKYWHYEVVSNASPAPANADRRNDGPKSQAFFQAVPTKRISKPVNPSASTVLVRSLACSTIS